MHERESAIENPPLRRWSNIILQPMARQLPYALAWAKSYGIYILFRTY